MNIKNTLFLVTCLVATAVADRQIVNATINIEAGDTLRITPGRELLFTDFTGITVNGHLQAIGTKQQPIVFASVNDTGGMATPFDWNGIEITGTGTAEFAYCLIANATFGITAKNAHSLTLTDCIFEGNDKHLSLAGEIQAVPDGQPFSHKATAPIIPKPDEITSSVAGAPTPEAMPAAPGIKQKEDRRTLGRILTGAGAAAAIGGGASLYSARQTAQDYNAYVPGNSKFDAATPEDRQRHYDQLRRDHSVAQAVGWSLLGLAASDFLYLVLFF